jgi:VIT1/CCC1 family predicted Fe2+/Mn2+ transporter
VNPDISSADIERYLRNWQNEVDSAAQYRELERLEDDKSKSEIYGGLAKVEEKHASFWESQLKKAGLQPKHRAPSWRSRFLIGAAKIFGPALVLPTIRDLEKVDQNGYIGQRETRGTRMSTEERQHAAVLERIDRLAPKGVEGSFLGKIEGRHRSVGGNALRASILGVNDGLCSNLSLVMGVFGLSTGERSIMLTGLAGLFAGACSMALGEWLSVTGSRELAEREIQIEADELESDPLGEQEELKLIYEGKGLSREEADDLSKKMIGDPSRALDTLTREELGIDPEEMGGNPNEAALFSFLLFSVGAIIPICPLFFFTGQVAFVLCVVFGGGALFGFGALTTVFTGKPALKSGFRQMALGLLAAGLTFVLGRVISL